MRRVDGCGSWACAVCGQGLPRGTAESGKLQSCCGGTDGEEAEGTGEGTGPGVRREGLSPPGAPQAC